jgi:hypothetical protein
MMSYLAVLGAAILVAPYVIDRVLRMVFRLMAYLFPSPVAGPDGWLIDTRSRNGVFDR